MALLQSKASVAMRDKGGSCPIHLAAENGLEGVVGQLLDAGAEVDAKDDVVTAAHTAAPSFRHWHMWSPLSDSESPSSVRPHCASLGFGEWK